MLAIVALFVALIISLLITRIATIALTLTGLSREIARFQARSAITGVGFTTSESERVMAHPIRRRILMLLMLIGNIGIVTVVTTSVITFVNAGDTDNWVFRIVGIISGLVLLLALAHSKWVDKHLSRFINFGLKKWTDLEVRDYAGLLRLGGEYQVSELQVQSDDWLAGKSLEQLNLSDEGILVLGIQKAGGDYNGAPHSLTVVKEGDVILLYGKQSALEDIDNRLGGLRGALAHQSAIIEQKKLLSEQKAELVDDPSKHDDTH